MSGGEVVLALNIAVCALFAAAYAILALTNRSQSAALWFSAGYLIGMISPISEAMIRWTGRAAEFESLGYWSFIFAILSSSLAYSRFEGRPVPWFVAGAIVMLAIALRLIMAGTPRTTLLFGVLYQLPVMLGSLQTARIMLQTARGRPLPIGLGVMSVIFALHFLLKPLLAVRYGGDRAIATYIDTVYALLSQAMTGGLLLAVGLMLLLVVMQRAISESQQASETDMLSGLPNRRGFERHANAVLARVARTGQPLAIFVFDLDHFKLINDRLGHAAGDAEIVIFAKRLQDHAPRGAVLGRVGGEEFVMLVEAMTAAVAAGIAEAIRAETARVAAQGGAGNTVSAGIAERLRGETLSELLRLGDQACYAAKRAGRNRVRLSRTTSDGDEVEYLAVPSLG